MDFLSGIEDVVVTRIGKEFYEWTCVSVEGGICEEMHSSELVQFVVVQSAAVAISVAVAVSAIGESGLSGIGVCSLSKGVGNTGKETKSKQVSKGSMDCEGTWDWKGNIDSWNCTFLDINTKCVWRSMTW